MTIEKFVHVEITFRYTDYIVFVIFISMRIFIIRVRLFYKVLLYVLLSVMIS